MKSGIVSCACLAASALALSSGRAWAGDVFTGASASLSSEVELFEVTDSDLADMMMIYPAGFSATTSASVSNSPTEFAMTTGFLDVMFDNPGEVFGCSTVEAGTLTQPFGVGAFARSASFVSVDISLPLGGSWEFVHGNLGAFASAPVLAFVRLEALVRGPGVDVFYYESTGAANIDLGGLSGLLDPGSYRFTFGASAQHPKGSARGGSTPASADFDFTFRVVEIPGAPAWALLLVGGVRMARRRR